MDIYYIDRESGEKKKELVAGEKLMRWTFESKPGMFFLEAIVKKKFISVLYGSLQNTYFSRRKVEKFVSEFKINLSEASREHPHEYRSFNDFFTRKLKPDARTVDSSADALISPSDGKILAYQNIDIDSLYQIKGSTFSLSELLGNIELAEEYRNGVFLTLRLAPSDYHRFHFIDDCTVASHSNIDGDFYSVNPISLKSIEKVFCQNKRELSVLDTHNFGKVLYLEVGATFVGSIVQTFKRSSGQKRGDEKGFFKFGGSTVLLLLKENSVEIDSDILKNTALGFETSVRMGEKIGCRID